MKVASQHLTFYVFSQPECMAWPLTRSRTRTRTVGSASPPGSPTLATSPTTEPTPSSVPRLSDSPTQLRPEPSSRMSDTISLGMILLLPVLCLFDSLDALATHLRLSIKSPDSPEIRLCGCWIRT